MPNIPFAPGIPGADSKNVSVPSGICMFWQSICPDGSLDDAISLGSVKGVEFTPNETTADIKTTYRGVMTTFKRVITDVSGTINFQIQEMVGSNLLLLFRPVTTVDRTVAGGNGVTVLGTVQLNLSGTTPVTISSTDLEYNPTTGTSTFPDLTIIRVEGTNMISAATGRATQYVEGTDYTFTQASSGTGTVVSYTDATGGTGAFSVGETLTGLVGVSYVDGDGSTLTPVASDDLFFAIEVNYTGGTGTVPEVGEVVTEGAQTGTIVKVISGATAAAGKIFINWDSDWADGANAAAVAGNRGFAVPIGGAVAIEAANVFDLGALAATGYALATGSNGTTGTILANATALAAGSSNSDDLVGTTFAVKANGNSRTAGATTLVAEHEESAMQVAVTATVASSDPTGTSGSVSVTGATGPFLKLGTITGGTSATSATISSTQATGNTTGATIARLAAGGIADGAAVNITFSYQRDGFCYSILDGAIITGRLIFQVLSTNGPQSQYTFFRVNLSIDGGITYNPEEEVAPTLSATILPDGTGARGEFCLLAGFSDFALTSC